VFLEVSDVRRVDNGWRKLVPREYCTSAVHNSIKNS